MSNKRTYIGDGLLECSRECIRNNTDCPNKECRLWIDFKEDRNCSLIAIHKNGNMTLRQIAERLKISFARVRQIEIAAIAKLKIRSLRNGLFF